MSCGSTTCNSTNFRRDLNPARRAPWPRRILLWLAAVIDESRRQQVWFELEKARQRGLLKNLEEWQLEDLGLTREQAEREARKPFWK
jgi:uncharacterized protein YjiS (DUF1127 family)